MAEAVEALAHEVEILKVRIDLRAEAEGSN